MNARSGRKRLFVTLFVVLFLLGGGVAGIFYYTSIHNAETGIADGTSQEDGAAARSGDVVLASDRGQSAEDGEAGETQKNGDEAAEAGDDDSQEAVDKRKSAIPVTVASIRTGHVSSYITSTANLIAEDEVEVLAEAEGRIETLKVEEGDAVRRGQVLASLVQDDEEIAVRTAKLRAMNAQMAYERAVKMVDESLMSREQFDKTTLDHEVAKQEIAEAEWRLEKTMIRAPFAGFVVGRMTNLGQNVQVGDALFKVSDFDPLIARIYLPEKDVIGLEQGRKVRITLKADEQIRFSGRIRQISPVVDTATGTVKVTIESEPPPPSVRPGAFVTIDVVRQTRPRVVLLPREAIIHELQEAFVFVANGDVAEKRRVALGLEEDGRIEAVSGVDAGEQVIVAGQGGLKDGSTIKVIPISEASDLLTVNKRTRRS